MNTRPFPSWLVALLAAAIILAAVPFGRSQNDAQTDVKIRLMAEALRARDAGDLAGAQKALAQLATLTPNDQAVQNLRTEIEAQAVARQTALAQQTAAQRAAEQAAAESAQRIAL